ncbi:MAG TPA: acyltransferase [Rhizomicrobium sp.]|nr:acyltransferase [Rhizomicrobium sp.]
MSGAAVARIEAAPGRPLHLDGTQASFARVPSLDGLWAVSILLVILSHYADSRLFPGVLGVLVFFVVSGFLITRLLFAEAKRSGRVNLRDFYLRRFFRLYPVVTVYAACVVLFFALSGRRIDWYEPLSALFYFANYLYSASSMAGHAAATSMPFAIFWSLSVEEHFYLFFPLLFILLRGKALVAWMSAICAGCLAARILLAQAHPEWLSTHVFYYTDIRLDSIAFGVLLAAICEERDAVRIVGLLERAAFITVAFATILLCMAVRNDWFRETLRYTLLGASTAAIVAAIVFSPHYRFVHIMLNLPFIRWIGTLSYSLYVWHTFVPTLLHAALPSLPRPLVAPMALAAAFAIAALSWYGLERPAAALRHRFGSQTVRT